MPYQSKSHLEKDQTGKSWKTAYSAVGVDALTKDLIVDGMNQQGLPVNVCYHPGFAEYAKFDPAKADNNLHSVNLTRLSRDRS